MLEVIGGQVMRERIVLIGAGSAVFTRGLVADLIRSGAEAELALVDIDPEALEVAERLARKMITARQSPIKLASAVDRRQVLRGATAVICTIAVGKRRAWEQDVFISRKHGIFMPVGDTVGPGGTSRALRMIPAMVDIAGDVIDLAPETLFFNYGNPMAPVCRAVRKATGANVVGLCHGVPNVARYLADTLKVSLEALQYTAVGINHLTWFISLRVIGRDLMPELHRIATQRLAQTPASHLKPLSSEDSRPSARIDPYESPCGDLFSWQLFQLFGGFPAPLDRHVTEFFPQFFREGSYYGHTLGVDAFSFEGTIADGDNAYEEMRADAYSPQPLREDYFEHFSGEHEQVIDIIDSIRRQRDRVFSANLPNTGQVPNLPPEAIIEAPAIGDGEGLRAIAQQPLPSAIAGTLATRYLWVETVVEAALEHSRQKFIQALVLDGAVHSIEQAEALADDMLQGQASHLPWIKRT